MKTWAEITKDYRATLGMTQKKMAEFLSVSISTYQSWEQGLRIPHSFYQDAIRKKFEEKVKEGADG